MSPQTRWLKTACPLRVSWHRCIDHSKHEKAIAVQTCLGATRLVSRHPCRRDQAYNSTMSQFSSVCVVSPIDSDLKHRLHSLQQLRYFSPLLLSQSRQGLQTRSVACHRQCSISGPVRIQMLQVIADNADKVSAVDDSFNREDEVPRTKEEEEEFYTLLLQLLAYRTIVAVKRQTWCGTAPTCRETMTQLHGAYGDTTYSRDETDTGC